MQLLFAIRKALFCKTETDPLVTRAIQLISVAKQSFPLSGIVHLMHATLILEVLHDPHGALIHLRTAKRMDNTIDFRFLVSATMQAAQDRNNEEKKRQEVDMRLTLATKHHKLCKALSGKFWQTILRSRADEGAIDMTALMTTVRSASFHEERAIQIFQELLRQHPNNTQVLRTYARFFMEIRNDKEAADQMFLAADELEERQSKKHRGAPKIKVSPEQLATTTEPTATGMTRGGSGVKFEVIDMKSEPPVARAKEGAPSGVVAVPLRDGDETEESKSVADSSLSLGSRGSEEAMRARLIRRKIEGTKSELTMRLHLLVFANFTGLVVCGLITYLVSQAIMTSFNSAITELSSTITSRHHSTVAVLNLREYELAMIRGENASKYCEVAMADMIKFENSFNTMFRKSGD
jgi:type IV secretory pathway VirB3-like protein